MKTIPSSQFRLTYGKLTEPTVVTVNGHAIGTWTPWTAYDADKTTIERSVFPLAPQDPKNDGTIRAECLASSPIPTMSQKQRDVVLRRMAK